MGSEKKRREKKREGENWGGVIDNKTREIDYGRMGKTAPPHRKRRRREFEVPISLSGRVEGEKRPRVWLPTVFRQLWSQN